MRKYDMKWFESHFSSNNIIIIYVILITNMLLFNELLL